MMASHGEKDIDYKYSLRAEGFRLDIRFSY